MRENYTDISFIFHTFFFGVTVALYLFSCKVFSMRGITDPCVEDCSNLNKRQITTMRGLIANKREVNVQEMILLRNHGTFLLRNEPS
jgi:hypothetical protein